MSIHCKSLLSALLLPAILAALPLAAIGATAATDLELSDAWVRALPPTQPNTAAYLTLTNRGSVAVSVVGASADVAGTVEMHTTREVDGLMRMEQLSELSVAPGSSVPLAPGGTHLMLLALTKMPAPGDKVRLCLALASGEEVCTVAPVRKSKPAAGSAEHHQHH